MAAGGWITRRVPVGAVTAGFLSSVVAPPVHGPAGAAPGGVVYRRRPARAVIFSRTGSPAPAYGPAGSPPGGLVVRRQSGGLLWGGISITPVNVTFRVARSSPSVTDPRDGTRTVTAGVTSVPSVS